MKIILIDIDSTRADHLGCYGYHRETSPNIDKVAAEGVRFDNYYCTDAPCLPSRTALMSGRFGIHTGVVGHGGTAADPRHEGNSRDFQDKLARQSLPAVLRKAGLRTVLVSPFAERHSAWTFYASFNEIYNTGKNGQETADEVTPTVIDWIQRNATSDNWFLYVNFWDPHTPYRTPLDYNNPFADSELPRWITDEVLEQHQLEVGPHTARDINMYDNQTNPEFPRQPGEILNKKDLRQMFDGYDTGIRYTDDHVGRILSELDSEDVLDDVAIIITADHGENQGELGIYGEHATADQGTCRIPMIMKWPGCKPGHVDDGLHYHLDLGPTLADLLGISPPNDWDGRSYSGVLQGKSQSRDTLVISQCAHVAQRSVRFDDWLYMRTYHDGYHLFPKEMLYNLSADPHEQHNVAQEHPDVCKEAVYRLNEWHDHMMSSMNFDVDPLWTVIQEGGPFHAKGNLKRYSERLKQSERGQYVPELMRRHPNEFF